MKNIPKNQPYTGVIEGYEFLGDVPLKMYFVDIKGRDPKKYEWKECGLSKLDVIYGVRDNLRKTDHMGVPHIAVAFPHVTAVYRFGDPRLADERETNIHRVGLGQTPELEDIVIAEPKPPFEVGCPAEINPVLANEMLYWANSDTISEYLTQQIPIGTSIKIKNPNKLRNSGI